MELPPIQIRPPFAGTRSSAASRTLGPSEAKDSRNVWTSDGDIRVRPRVRSLLTDNFTYPASLFPVLMIRAVPIFANGQFWLLTVHILNNGSTHVKISDPTSGVQYKTHTMAYTNAAGWRVGISQFRDTIFVMCGVATNCVKFWYDGGWQSDIVGAGLHGTPSSALQAGGNLTADTTYSYRCTYYSSITGTESAPSAATSQTTAPGFGRIQLTGLTASADAAINYRRIYRKQELVDDTWYFYDVQADTETTYTDDAGISNPNAQVLKTIDNRMPLFAFDVTDNIAVCSPFKRRMWYALDGQPGVYVHSEYDRPESINALNTYAANEDDSDPVIGVAAVDEALYWLRLRSIDVITGDTPESFVCTRLVAGIGCASQSSICVVGSRVYFMSIEGVHVIDGGQVSAIPLSDPIRDKLRASEALGLSVGAIDTEAGRIIFSVPIAGFEIDDASVPPRPINSTGYEQFVYDYRRDRWFIWRMHARGVGVIQRNFHAQYPREVITEIRPPTASAELEFKIGILDVDGTGPDFELYPIEWYWETGDFDLGSAKDKHFYYATVLWQSGGDDAPVRLYWFRNQSAIPLGVAEWPANADPSRGKANMGFGADTIRFKVGGNANHQLRIVGLDFEVEPKGQR